MNRSTDSICATLASLLSCLAWVLYFTNLVPLTFSVTPHVGKSNIIFFENLDKSVRLAADLAFYLSLEVRKLFHVDFLTALSCSLALLFVLTEVRSVFLLAIHISRKRSDLLVFSSYDNIAILIVSHGPNCLWELNCLFALSVSPELDSAIVAPCDDFTSLKTINTKDEAIMAFEVHHMGAIH